MRAITHPESALVSERMTTTSLCLAKRLGKDHKAVLRKIEALEIPDDWHERNFAPMQKQTSTHNGGYRTDTFYEMTRDGFSLLFMSFNGKRATEWKIKFLDAFNAMEAKLRGQSAFGPIKVKKFSEDPRMAEALEASHDLLSLEVERVRRELAKLETAQDVLRINAASERASLLVRENLDLGRG